MAHKFRSLISNKITQVLGNKGVRSSVVIPHVKVDPKSSSQPEFLISLKALQKEGLIQCQSERKCLLDFGSDIVKNLGCDSAIPNAYLLEDKRDVKIKFQVAFKNLAEDIIRTTTLQPNSFWQSSPLLALLAHEHVVIDFSSPNIAKPFHVGHLRSTILGNFIANLHISLGHQVTKINYLGDWGTQFGLLKYGYDAKNMTEDDLENNAIKKLYDVYVWANEKAAEDPNVYIKAREIFSKMELGEGRELETWELFRRVSIKDLKQMYHRLGVNFDEFHGESMYGVAVCKEVLSEMEQNGLLEELNDGRKVYNIDSKKKVTVVKSDGSSIYLTRDIAGAVDRYNRYKFTKMYYVVDNSQTDHFCALFSILKNLGKEWAKSMEHIKFGRVLGMSTRKGNAIFLEDLLNEAHLIMQKNQQTSSTTKQDDEMSKSKTADILAVSAVLIGDMKQRRLKDYVFSWEKALQSRGDTGVKLQYLHCRLINLEENCGIQYEGEANMSSLTELEAKNIIREIARFDEVLLETYNELEPCILVNYLLKFAGIINAGIKTLQVKSQPRDIAVARLALFIAARHTLAAGMNILGLQPLKRM